MIGEAYILESYTILINYYEKGELKEFLSETRSFSKFELYQNLNMLSEGTLTTICKDWLEAQAIKDFRISILVDSFYNLEFDFGVTDVSVGEGNFIIYKGIFTKSENFLVNRSNYLGDNVEDSIKNLNLGFKNFVNFKSYKKDFFQFNESNLSIFYKILYGAVANQIFVIDNDTITITNLKEASFSQIGQSGVETNNEESVVNLGTIKAPVSYIDNYKYIVSESGSTSNFTNFTRGEFTNNSFGLKDDYLFNVYQNLRFIEGVEVSGIYEEKRYIPYQIGSKVNIGVVNGDKPFLIIGRQIYFDSKIRTKVKFGFYE